MKKAVYSIKKINDSRFITIKEIEELGFLRHFISCKPLETLNSCSIIDYLNDTLKVNNMNIKNSVYLKQTHSSNYYEVDSSNYNLIKGMEGDALIVHDSNIPIGVLTADCVPVIIVDKVKKLSAVVHAGWRGTEKEIVKKVIGYMLETKKSKTDDILCVIGPCIGPCCFEVGDEVAVKFSYVHEKKGKTYVDLINENKNQMTLLNIPEDNIYYIDLCTKCNSDLLASYRADGSYCGRIGTFIEII